MVIVNALAWGWRSRSLWAGYVVGLAGVATVSVLIGLTPSLLRMSNISILYLTVALAVATIFGRWPAIFASVMAFLSFNWFFVEPVHTPWVSSPEEWLSLLLLFLTSIVTGQLAAEQRQRAQEAAKREREAVLLQDVVGLIGQIDFSRALRDIAERLLHEMRLVGVAIEIENFDGTVTDVTAGEVGSNPYLQSATGNRRHLSPTSLVQGSPTAGELSKSQLAPAYAPSDSFLKNVAPTLHIVPILAQNRSAGRMLLVQYQDSTDFSATDSRLLLAVAGQIGLAVERNYLRKEAADSEIWRRSDTMKDAMLNAVSHDLRTPLASILASAGTLRQSQSDADGEEATQLAGAIEEEARRLDHLVGSLLDLSRIRGGALRPLKAWRDFGTLVDDVLGRLKPLMVNHTLVVEIPDEMPPAYLDHVEIYQVLSNLIENAIKYTPAGGQIDIAVRCNDEYVEVEISDRGPGIPVSDLPFVFEPFYRGPGTGPRPQGSGLGLAVAKGFVEAHGGRIWAENRPSGGAKVSFTLPLFQDVDIGNTDREPR